MKIRLEGIICTPEQFTNEQVVEQFLSGHWPSRRVWLWKEKEEGPEVELIPSVSQAVLLRCPDGFHWGCWHSGSFQLAFAICLELFGERVARQVYEAFTYRFILPLSQEEDFQQELALTDFMSYHLDKAC